MSPDEATYACLALIIYSWVDSLIFARWYGQSLARRILTIFIELGIDLFAIIWGSTKYEDLAGVIGGVGLFAIFMIVLFPVLAVILEITKLILGKLWSYTHITGIGIVNYEGNKWVKYLLIEHS